MTINLLAILLSIAMMFSGAAGLETDGPMATSLTISDVYLEYNDNRFELEPSLSAGVMTENGTAVFDFSMQCGEDSLFPMQLVVTEDAATLVAEKNGKAFTIDAETLNALVAEAVDMDEFVADGELTEAMDEIKRAWAQAATGFSMDQNAEAIEALNAKIEEMIQPVETEEGVETYEETEYQVSTAHVVLGNDQLHELIDTAIQSSEEGISAYNELLASINEAIAAYEEEPVEITSLKQACDMIGMAMSMDMSVSTTEDGLYQHVSGIVSLSMEEVSDPVEVEFDVYNVNGTQETQAWSDVAVEDINIHVEASAYNNGESNYFEYIIEGIPADDASEEDIFSLYMVAGVVPSEDEGKEYSFEFEVTSPDVDLGIIIDGQQDEEGNNAIDVDFEYSDAANTVACGCALDISNAVFANAAEGLTPIKVNPENIEAVEAEITPVAESLMIDLQTLVENDSVGEIISAFMFMTLSGTEEVEVEEIDGEYEEYEEMVIEEENSENAEITFEAPEFGYIPEGLALEGESIETEYNSASYTFADENYDNTIYVYVYGDAYAVDSMSYVLGDDGSMTAVEGRTISVQTEEDAIYAELKDGATTINISYYGTDLGVEEIGKLLAGMTY